MNPLRSLRHYVGQFVMWSYKKYLQSMGNEIGTGGMISLYAHEDVRRGKVVIGDNVTITAGCYILSHSAVENRINPNKEPRTKTVIEDNVFIGVNSVVLPGVKIGKNSIIGAGSVVTSDVEPNSVYAGNPAKLIKKLK